jgi:hypothetical protein
MRKLLLIGGTLAALAAAPVASMAQTSTLGGAAVGAGTGALIGGPPGAIVGGVIGGTVGASQEGRYYRAEPRRHRERACWVDSWGRQFCEWR